MTHAAAVPLFQSLLSWIKLANAMGFLVVGIDDALFQSLLSWIKLANPAIPALRAGRG